MRILNRNLIYPLFVSLFIGGVYYSFLQSPEIFTNLEFSSYFIACFGIAFFGIYINSKILSLLFSVNKVSLNSSTSLKYSVFSSVAALVPVVGASGMKFVLLKRNNVASKSSLFTLSVSVFAYVASIFIISSIGLFIIGNFYAFAFLVALSILSLFFCFLLSLVSSSKVLATKFPALLFFNFCLITQESLRVWLCYIGVGYVEEIASVLVYQASNLASLGGSSVPGGIGIKETGAALIANSVGSDSAVAFIVFSINRLIGYAALFLCYTGIIVYEKCDGHS